MRLRHAARFAIVTSWLAAFGSGCGLPPGDAQEDLPRQDDRATAAPGGDEVDDYDVSPESAAAPHGRPGEAFIQTPQGDVVVRFQEIDGLAVAEGDIVLGPMRTVSAGNATAARRWPGGVVPYAIDAALPKPERVTLAMKEWETRVGFRFVPRTTETAWITFKPSTVCRSYIGRIGKEQVIELAPGCGTGAAIHEIGHAIGLWHEQGRSDRDQYVKIHPENIKPEAIGNFDKRTFTSVGSYDLGSIMHYGSFDFSANGKPTITRLDGSTFTANRTALSAGDIAGVREIYATENLAKPATPMTAKTTVNLNLRKGPGTTFAILLTMPKGSTVTRTGATKNGFDELIYAGTTGWASVRYLE